ncbi:MAG: phenylacetate--CoA ligase family protein [Candidatus Sungbacteria bacterium]|nr:phenylacetate--CoA ligase family protein [Candidatus Sungbacteria bacterium]
MRELISADTFEKFKAMVSRVAESPRSNFYKEKFREARFHFNDLRVPDDILKVPLLSREELSRTTPFERLYVDLDKVKYVRYTSGTSGSHAMLLLKSEQRYRIPGKRPLILFSSNQLDVHYAQAPRAAAWPYFPPLIHAAQNMAITAVLAEAYGVDAIVGFPSRMVEFAKSMSEVGRGRVESLFILGERFTQSLAQVLHDNFPRAILDPRYGMSEVGLPGYQCDELRQQGKGVYHCDLDYLLEITEPETGHWMQSGQEGEIVVTELYESPHQVIRYRTGDAGRITSAACSCGAPFTFEVTGRADFDIVKIGGGVLRTDEIERVIGRFSDRILPDFRGTVELCDGKVFFYLNIIPRSPDFYHPVALQALREAIAEHLFLTPSKTLKDFLAEERFTDFVLQLVAEFPKETKAQRLRFISQ